MMLMPPGGLKFNNVSIPLSLKMIYLQQKSTFRMMSAQNKYFFVAEPDARLTGLLDGQTARRPDDRTTEPPDDRTAGRPDS